jgi:hypothetical protein
MASGPSSGPPPKLGLEDLLKGFALYAGLVCFVLGFLVFRGISLARAFGLRGGGWSPATVVGWLVMFLPIIYLCQALVYAWSGPDTRPQPIVDFLLSHTGWQERAAVLAVAVIAAGFDSLALMRSAGGPALPLNPLRGQLVFGPLPPNAQMLPRFPVNGLGNFIGHVPLDGHLGWVLGSTFERGCAEPRIDAGEVGQLQARLQQLLPAGGEALREQFERAEVRAWAAVRCTVPDRLPVVGALDPDDLGGLMVCTGMGARGMTLAVLCGEVLAAQLCGEPLPVPLSQARALAPQRLHKHLSAPPRA